MTFDAWKTDFLDRTDFPASLADHLVHLDAPGKADASQAETRKTLKDYLDRVVTQTRIDRGRKLKEVHADLFETLKRRFPVPSEILLAIWGMETNFGSILGDVPVFAALATLAHQGRRRTLFEDQLLAAAWMVGQGHDPDRMIGSWAGAMGHTQFMPTSIRDFAVGMDGGRPNLVGDDPTDALASAAHYLTKHGWLADVPSFIECTWPEAADLRDLRHLEPMRLESWQAKGVTPRDPINQASCFRFLLPAGHSNPGFLVSANFDALLAYNRADAYALAVALLAQEIAGSDTARPAWNPATTALSQQDMRQLQLMLTEKGFDTFGADGFTGPNTIKAIEAYQVAHGLPVDGYADEALLGHIRS